MFEVRPCADQDEYGRAIGAIGQYFNPPPGDEFLQELVPLLPHDRMHAALAGRDEGGGKRRSAPGGGGGERCPPVYDQVRRERPGMTSRSAQWWKIRHLRIGNDEKDAPRRFVAFDIDGETQGYAIYRTF